MEDEPMKRRIPWLLSGLLVLLVAAFWAEDASQAEVPGQGTLNVIEPDGKVGSGCPLEHTSVKAEISGFVSRVTVTQVFHNPRQAKIEAVYTFPLPGDAAVDDMLMRVGDRVVKGEIKRREEARRIYEQARDRGHVASLLDQERPNIFTQSVANIMPGQKVEITIKYVEMLPYDDGAFTFVFPMVVGPRFIPGSPSGRQDMGWSPDTDQVPDASRITPPVTPKGTRAGHDIDLTVSIDAGVPIGEIKSELHEVDVSREGKQRAKISLKNRKEIPNRDFVLKYLVAGDEIRSGFLAHKDGKDGYMALIMIPPKRVKPEQVAPKEMIFVIDRSGSQRGRPLQKAKEAIKYVIEHMNPDDTFNVIDFGSTANMLFSEPKKNTAEYREKALRYIETLDGNGGTWMGPAVELACKTPPPENRLRIVTFMTDGYVGNDFEIISLVKRLRGESRWFPFGTGNSVNRLLLDNMARVGGGEVDYVLLNSSGEAVGKKFYDRISTPVLTNIALVTEGVSLEQVYPEAVSDLWDRKPLIFKARYSRAGKGKVTITGLSGGKPYKQVLDVTLPEKESANSSLGALWARSKVDDLMGQDWMGLQRGNPKAEIREEIIRVALKHRIMTQFTSFVAVEETVVTVGGKPTKVAVPVEMPEGVSYEGVFGEQSSGMTPTAMMGARRFLASPAPASRRKAGQRQLSMGGNYGRVLQGLPSASAEARAERKGGGAVEQSRADGATARPSQSPGNARTAALHAKLAPELLALLSMKGPVTDYSQGKVTVKDGKIAVQIWLTKTSDEVLNELKKKGMEVSFSAVAAKMVIGVIALDKLADLVDIQEITRIEPLPVG
jgi:Ca-activated chloride channel family protein